jgi:hypothetical protein
VKRKPISASTRWQIFARDGFRCRYCGIQAGEPGVTLHLDHVVSVADGGTNAYDNLVTACQRCNGGKSARSLDEVPGSAESIENLHQEAATLQEQADALQAAIEARAELQQAAVNMVCEAYGVEKIRINNQDWTGFVQLVREHGADVVVDWVNAAASRGVREWECLRYVRGIVRAIREKEVV